MNSIKVRDFIEKLAIFSALIPIPGINDIFGHLKNPFFFFTFLICILNGFFARKNFLIYVLCLLFSSLFLYFFWGRGVVSFFVYTFSFVFWLLYISEEADSFFQRNKVTFLLVSFFILAAAFLQLVYIRTSSSILLPVVHFLNNYFTAHWLSPGESVHHFYKAGSYVETLGRLNALYPEASVFAMVMSVFVVPVLFFYSLNDNRLFVFLFCAVGLFIFIKSSTALVMFFYYYILLFYLFRNNKYFVLVSLFLFVFLLNSNSILFYISKVFSVGEGSTKTRYAYAQTFFNMFKDNFWFGVGKGNVINLYQAYIPKYAYSIGEFSSNVKKGIYSGSVGYLLILCEIGIVFSVFLFLIIMKNFPFKSLLLSFFVGSFFILMCTNFTYYMAFSIFSLSLWLSAKNEKSFIHTA